MNTRQVGRLCETAVCADLQKRGAQVLATNYTCREGELDIIAREGEYIIFVEVKARQSSRFGTPAQAVTRAKQKKLILAAPEIFDGNGDRGGGALRCGAGVLPPGRRYDYGGLY